MRDLAGGKRRIIKASDVKTIHVPHFEGLSIATMLCHAKSFPQVFKALPTVESEILKLPRAYISNVIYRRV